VIILFSWLVVLRIQDQAHNVLEEKVVPGPVNQHHQPVTEANEIDQVYNEPYYPGNKSFEGEAADMSYRRITADRGHMAAIPVVKRPQSFSC
jgi:hypothetical protein